MPSKTTRSTDDSINLTKVGRSKVGHLINRTFTRSKISSFEKSEASKGLIYSVIGAMLFAVMGSLVFQAQVLEPKSSVLVGSFIRSVVNLIILAILASRVSTMDLWGDRQLALWLRGLFGTLGLMASFISLEAIGLGESSFLRASNGVFVAALSPWLLKQRNGWLTWLAIGGCLVGLALLFQPRFDDVNPFGRAAGLSAGFFAALAYLMIAKAGRDNSPSSVIFYLCLVATLMHPFVLFFTDAVWPRQLATYTLLIGAALVATVAQFMLTKGYQMAPAALAAAVGYLGPVFALILGVLFFGDHPDQRATLGAGIIVFFGASLPFIRLRRQLHSRTLTS